MAHFAKIENGIVTQILVAEQDIIDTFPDAKDWVQTSYNTLAGEHIYGGTPLRKNYAGIGSLYNKELDAFITPSPFPSWVLNETTGIYQAPIPRPMDDNEYLWDEDTLSWKPTKL